MIKVCWQKEEDENLASMKSFDDDDLWKTVKDLMMIHGKCWRLKEWLYSRDTLKT